MGWILFYNRQMKVFHIIPKTEWIEAKKAGLYAPKTLEDELGFVHCAKADQVLLVANKFYKGHAGLLILRINTLKLVESSKFLAEPPYESPWSKEIFPHIYGPVNIDAVEATIEFPLGDGGCFSLPDGLFD